MVPWAIVVVMGLWDHRAGRGFRAELLPISGSLIVWPFQNPWSTAEVMLAFFTFPSTVESLFDSLLVWWAGSHQIHALIFLVAVLYPLSSLAALWEAGPLCWKSHLHESCSKCQNLPFFSPWRWLNLCSTRCERFAGWFIGLMLFLRMFAEGFTVSGHCWEFFLLSFYHLVFYVFGGWFLRPCSSPILFLIAGD